MSERQPPQVLSYATDSGLSRRRARRLVFWVLVGTVFFACYRYGNPFVQRMAHNVRLLYWQHRWEQYHRGPDQVVLETDPQKAAELMAKPEYEVSGYARHGEIVPCVFQPQEPRNFFGAGSQGTLFWAKLKTPAGAERWVCVQFEWGTSGFTSHSVYKYWQGNLLVLTAATTSVGSLLHAPTCVWWSNSALKIDSTCQQPFRFYAGQVDAVNRSHFTMDYVYAGQRGTIDGYLDNADHATFVPRSGTTAPDKSGRFTLWNPVGPVDLKFPAN